MMWALCLRTKLLDLNLSFFSTLTLLVCLHPLNHTVLPLLNGWKLNWCKSFWNIHPQPIISIITMLPQILLHCSPGELNEVQLTVKFWGENTKMSHCLNGFLNKIFLFLEIRLQWKNSCGTTVGCFRITFTIQLMVLVFFVLADKQQTIMPEASLTKNLFHAFGLTWMLQMILRKYHWLWDPLSIMNEPAISHFRFCTTWIEIHLWDTKCVRWICWVPLRVINHK